MSNEDIKAKWAEYDRQKKAFTESHEPCECYFCGNKIDPGQDITVHDGNVYCSHECVCSDLDILELSFQIDGVADDGYREYFTKD